MGIAAQGCSAGLSMWWQTLLSSVHKGIAAVESKFNDEAPSLLTREGEYGYLQIFDYAKLRKKRGPVNKRHKVWVSLPSDCKVYTAEVGGPRAHKPSTVPLASLQPLRSCLRQKERPCQNEGECFFTPRSSSS